MNESGKDELTPTMRETAEETVTMAESDRQPHEKASPRVDGERHEGDEVTANLRNSRDHDTESGGVDGDKQVRNNPDGQSASVGDDRGERGEKILNRSSDKMNDDVNDPEEDDEDNMLETSKATTDDVNQFDSVSNVRSHAAEKTTATNEHRKTDTLSTNQVHAQSPKLKKAKKGICVSYSPDAGFVERKFVVELVRQLKENNLAEDIWFDKDEKNTDSPCWFSLRMEAIEKCRAAILVLSDSYFSCPVSVYEGKTLLERKKSEPHSVQIFPISFSLIEKTEIPKEFSPVLKNVVDLSTDEHARKSLAEKTSVVIGAIMEDLEKHATMVGSQTMPEVLNDGEYSGEFKRKKISQWNVVDLQEWLFKLGIKEFYRQSLAENMVDGFLLMSLTDQDMIHQLGIDSRVVRKKIMQQILQTLDREHKQPGNWHLRARAQRAKPDVIYLIYDPADVRLAQNIRTDLRKKSLQVIHHDSLKLGRSKDDFLQINGPHVATASHVIVLMTEAAASSPFLYHEVLFADWLGKKLVTAMFKNTWPTLRSSLKAVLGDCPAIDFETKMYSESIDVLEHHIKPLRRVPGVVLEQAYLNKMAEGLKPLELLACQKNGLMSSFGDSEGDPKVFISYQWDMQAKVDDIKYLLEASGFPCWSDITMTPQPTRGHSSRSTRSSIISVHIDIASDTLQSQIQRNMKASSVVLCCITPKYLQSDNCKKDLMLAEMFNKPIIPILLRFTSMESAPDQVRKIFAKLNYIDLSNERLYKQNLPLVFDRVKKVVNQRT